MDQKNEVKSRPKFKRSFWRIINKTVQIRYSLVVIWLIIIALMLGGMVTYLTVWNLLLEIPIHDPAALEQLQRQVLRLLTLEFLIGGVVLVVLAGVLELRILHRICGPLFRLEQLMGQLAEGKLPKHPLVFREKDFFYNLAESFNRAVEAIRCGKKFE
ncbi:MAG: HAMP domain protein [candidate division TA06 bacterium ADurb.Bin417]|uniref:HAMP domain protein n=1 Tax=candidate division TA06 bacterium ADurb.Bin417 TaxID=1852828 RepID=A0A1V5MHI3_UNCT6|nr:MAG: HAMP domain protein [candidate division TA06 bacterium ADurb.Bin417]